MPGESDQAIAAMCRKLSEIRSRLNTIGALVKQVGELSILMTNFSFVAALKILRLLRRLRRQSIGRAGLRFYRRQG